MSVTRLLWRAGFLCACLLAIAAQAGAGVYYVATWGKDAWSGAADQPWASLGQAGSRLKPGDTLYIKAGRYQLDYGEDVLRPNSGTAANWITIRGEEGARPVLAGAEDLGMAIDLAGCSYLSLGNLEITSDNGKPFRDGIGGVGDPCSHLRLSDLYVHHLDEFGLNLQDVEELQVVNSRFEYCGFGAMGGPEGEAGGWRDVLIQGCTLSYSGRYYRGGDGSGRPYDRPDGFGIEASSGPITILDCQAAYNLGDGLDSKASNTLISRCIVANNSCDGVKLWGDGSRVESTLIHGRGAGDPAPSPWSPLVISSDQAGARFEVVNVTIDDQLGGNYLLHAQYDQPRTPIELTLRNNIFRGVGPRSPLFLGRASSLTLDHNLFHLPSTGYVLDWGRAYGTKDLADLGAGNLTGDPLFARPAWGSEGDYHLQAGSPALGAGSSLGAPGLDLGGAARGNPPSLGAYER